MDPKRIAHSLVREHKTRNPFQIAEELGYIVMRVPLVDVWGFYHTHNRCTLIYVADHLSTWEARFVCAHEIGHALMHKGYNELFMLQNTQLKITPLEKEADIFAATLLFDGSYYCNSDLVLELEEGLKNIAQHLWTKYRTNYYIFPIVDEIKNAPSQAPTPETGPHRKPPTDHDRGILPLW